MLTYNDLQFSLFNLVSGIVTVQLLALQNANDKIWNHSNLSDTKQIWGLLKTAQLSYIFLLKNQKEYWMIQVNLEK